MEPAGGVDLEAGDLEAQDLGARAASSGERRSPAGRSSARDVEGVEPGGGAAPGRRRGPRAAVDPRGGRRWIEAHGPRRGAATESPGDSPTKFCCSGPRGPHLDAAESTDQIVGKKSTKARRCGEAMAKPPDLDGDPRTGRTRGADPAG